MTDTLSKLKQFTVLAYEKGYRINESGLCISPRGIPLKPCYHHKSGLDYARFAFKGNKVYWHHLAAYQKFSQEWLLGKKLVRHLDGNSKNNSANNIALGTQYDNTMDIPPEKRKRDTTNMRFARRKFSEEQIREIRELAKNKSYESLARLYKCDSLTISNLVKRKTYADIE